MHKLLLSLLSLVFAGCVSGTYPVSSPYYQIPAGSQLVLSQKLTIAPNYGRIYLQYGKVVSKKDIDRYYPHCWFLSWKVLETAQVIDPDTFIVVVSQKYEEIIQRNTQVQLAARSGLHVGIDAGGPTAIESITELNIHSDTQPDIRRFACSHWQDPPFAEHLTVEQMQTALGNVATIKLQIPSGGN